MSAASNLLDEALGADGGRAFSSHARFVLVEDCIETSGAFVLHHVLKRSLPPSLPRGSVILVALANPFSHYDRVLRKLGCNLSAQRDVGSFHFIDMLQLEIKDSCESVKSAVESGPIQLFEKIQMAVAAVCNAGYTTIMIDDLSLLEIAANGSANHVLDILHYCATLTSGMDGSIVAMNHADVYSDIDTSRLLSHLEYLADIMIKTQPLATGLAADVHGQLTVINKRADNGHKNSGNMVHNFHFKVKENGVTISIMENIFKLMLKLSKAGKYGHVKVKCCCFCPQLFPDCRKVTLLIL